MKMQIGKWGNSLAVRLPRDIVEKYNLAEGKSIDSAAIEAALQAADANEVKERRVKALEEIRTTRLSLPADWKFDREDANWRPAMDRW